MRLANHRQAARQGGANAGGGTKPLAAADGAALAERINQEHRACVEASRTALEHAIRCGELLDEAWEAVEFGHWMTWVKENFEGSKSTEENYRRLANNKQYLIEPDSQRAANLSIREALALLVPERDDSDGVPSSGHSTRGAGGAGKEATRKPGRSEPGGARPALAGPDTAKTVLYRLGDLPARPGDLETALGDGRAVTISCDVPTAPTAGERTLREVEAFLEAAARAAGAKHCDAHLLVICSADPEIRDAAERALAGGGDEASDEEREKEDEARLIRHLEKEERSRLYRAVMEFGGLKTRGSELREEYRAIPNVYKRKEGLPGDEMADLLATHYPDLCIRDERGLIDELTRRWRAA